MTSTRMDENERSLTSSPASISTLNRSQQQHLQQLASQQHSTVTPSGADYRQPALSKYVQLLAVIEDMGRDIRPTYSGSKSSAERLKRGIGHARILVRECLIETERSAKS